MKNFLFRVLFFGLLITKIQAIAEEYRATDTLYFVVPKGTQIDSYITFYKDSLKTQTALLYDDDNSVQYILQWQLLTSDPMNDYYYFPLVYFKFACGRKYYYRQNFYDQNYSLIETTKSLTVNQIVGNEVSIVMNKIKNQYFEYDYSGNFNNLTSQWTLLLNVDVIGDEFGSKKVLNNGISLDLFGSTNAVDSNKYVVHDPNSYIPEFIPELYKKQPKQITVKAISAGTNKCFVVAEKQFNRFEDESLPSPSSIQATFVELPNIQNDFNDSTYWEITWDYPAAKRERVKFFIVEVLTQKDTFGLYPLNYNNLSDYLRDTTSNMSYKLKYPRIDCGKYNIRVMAYGDSGIGRIPDFKVLTVDKLQSYLIGTSLSRPLKSYEITDMTIGVSDLYVKMSTELPNFYFKYDSTKFYQYFKTTGTGKFNFEMNSFPYNNRSYIPSIEDLKKRSIQVYTDFSTWNTPSCSIIPDTVNLTFGPCAFGFKKKLINDTINITYYTNPSNGLTHTLDVMIIENPHQVHSNFRENFYSDSLLVKPFHRGPMKGSFDSHIYATNSSGDMVCNSIITDGYEVTNSSPCNFDYSYIRNTDGSYSFDVSFPYLDTNQTVFWSFPQSYIYGFKRKIDVTFQSPGFQPFNVYIYDPLCINTSKDGFVYVPWPSNCGLEVDKSIYGNEAYFWANSNIPLPFGSYEWNFGDGSIGNSQWTYHAYSKVGKYQVLSTFTSYDSSCTYTDTINVDIESVPTPVFTLECTINTPTNVAFQDGLAVLYRSSDQDSITALAYAFIDINGKAVFNGVPQGNYTIMALPYQMDLFKPTYTGNVSSWANASIVSIVENKAVSITLLPQETPKFTWNTGSDTIQGLVGYNQLFSNQRSDDDLFPVYPALVTLLDSVGNFLSTTSTDKFGNYMFPNAKKGVYQVNYEIFGAKNVNKETAVVDGKANTKSKSFIKLKKTSRITKLNDIKLNENALFIYPNPVEDYVKINNKDLKFDKAVILDIIGKEVAHLNLASEEEGNQLNLNCLPRGIYIIKLIGPKGEHYNRFLKK